MKLTKILLGVAVFGLSGAAFAGGDRAPFDCHVEDYAGNVLEPASHSLTSDGDTHTLTASAEIFSYTVTLVGREAKAEFVDTRSGDKVVMTEGDFDSGEHIAVELVTDEVPDMSIKLVCIAR
jgi:hypothetical protein